MFGGQEYFGMESKVPEHTSHYKQVNRQVSTSLNYRPSDTMKTYSDELGNGGTREQVVCVQTQPLLGVTIKLI